MTLRFAVFGREVWTLELDVRPEEIAVGTVDRVIKRVSRFWVGAMSR